MAANKRIIFAAEQFCIAPGSGFTAFNSGHAVHGVQSLGMKGDIPIQTIEELGQADPYEQLEDVPNFEVSAEKCQDGYPMMWHKSTSQATYPTLLGRSADRCQLAFSIYDDTLSSASGTANYAVWHSGFYPANFNFNVPIDGPTVESMTWVGNTRKWYSANYRTSEGSSINILTGFFTSANWTMPDSPLAASGIMRRQDVLFDYSATQGTDTNGLPVYTSGTSLPRNIPGIDASGRNADVGGGVICDYAAKLQSIKFATNLARDDIKQLGCKMPYFKATKAVIDVTTDIEVISTSGDWVEAIEAGLYTGGDNTRNESIRLALRDGTRISTGPKNRLTTFTVGGGGTDGANETVTYSYKTTNNLTVLHPADPTFGSNVRGYTLVGGTGSGTYF